MSFPHDLVIRKVLGKKEWVLVEPFEYVTSHGATITVPYGFVTDLTTMWREKYAEAAVIHDYCLMLYTRDQARDIFDEALHTLESHWLEHKVMMFAVWLNDLRYRFK